MASNSCGLLFFAIEGEPALTSVLQRLWDHRLKGSNILLALPGSHAGMIERAVLAYRSPLYNRATANLHLQPMAFGVLSQFFPRYTVEERASIYACVGGYHSTWNCWDRGCRWTRTFKGCCPVP